MSDGDALAPQPAYNTKQVSVLRCTIAGKTYDLEQNDTSRETGSTLWLSSQVLCEYLSEVYNKGAKQKSVIELGSGIGLTALVLNSIGFKVTASDTGAVCEKFLRPNLVRNKGDGVEVLQLDWLDGQGEGLICGSFDVVVASDVVYETTLVPGLCATINKVMQKSTVLYVAQEVRDPGVFAQFLERLSGLGINGAQVPHAKISKIMRGSGWEDEMWEGVVLWKFKRRIG